MEGVTAVGQVFITTNQSVAVNIAVNKMPPAVLMVVVVHLLALQIKHVVVRQNLMAAVLRRQHVDLTGASLLLSEFTTEGNTCSPLLFSAVST